MYTKDQIKTLSAKDLLLSWTSGQGATGKTPDAFAHVKAGAINNTPVSIDYLTALAEMLISKSNLSQSFFDAMAKGYLSKNHFDQYESGDNKKSTVPLPGHYMDSEQFLINSYKEFISFEKMLDCLLAINDSMSKDDIITSIKACLTLPGERMAAIQVLRDKEESLYIARVDLSTYLDNVTIVNEKTLRGMVSPSLDEVQRGDLGKLLSQSFKTYQINAVNAQLDGFTIIRPAGVEVVAVLKD